MPSQASPAYSPVEVMSRRSSEEYEKKKEPFGAAPDGVRGASDKFSYGRRRSPRALAWLPAFAAALCSFALVCGLLSWLFTRRVRDHLPSEDSQFSGAIVVLEGPSSAPTRNSDGTIDLDSTLYGLTISTIATKVVSFATPIVVGVFALRLAKDWIRAQEEQRGEDIPTPAQYGLLIKLCTSASLMSLYESGVYLGRKTGQRAKAPPVFILALVAVILMLFLSYALSAVDIWLHSTSKAFLHTEIHSATPDTLPHVGSDIDLNVCPGPAVTFTFYEVVPPEGFANYTNCVHWATSNTHGPLQGWGNASLMNVGLAALKNDSTQFRTVAIGDYAVLVSASLPQNLQNATFDTFAISASCQPVSNCVTNDAPDLFTVACPSLNVPTNSTFDLNMTSSVQSYNVTANQQGDTYPAESKWGYRLGTVLNPYGALVNLGFVSSEDAFLLPNANTPGWYMMPESGFTMAYYYGACTVTAYNVSVSYTSAPTSSSLSDVGTYTLTSTPVLSNFNTTSALFAALDDAYAPDLTTYLQSTLTPALNVSSDTFSTLLAQNLSFAMASMASPLFMATPATGGQTLAQRVASRYGAGALYTFIALLALYGVLCVVLGAFGACASSRELVVDGRAQAQATRTEVEHVHLRLSDPLVLVAERFADAERQGRALETSALEMFGEHPGSARLGVFAEETGEAGAPLGLFRRK
ncbi:hypothetical protein PsYK624_144120 [Phanerochaete sordida]|uniref:Uncharacterized protein n=1 Tax=Phanerochaete sordida TaxID=48140 RepID=A0A9P3GRK7_9APHY|nr:hypothetical protein PsYK624_144120 [Phanerochaete sordida]